MGNKLFGTNISGLINKHVGSGVLKGTLHKTVQGTRDAADISGGKRPTETDHGCRAFFATAGETRVETSIIKKGTKVAVIIGDSIVGGEVPQVNDKLTLEGGKVTITGPIERDPAAATYICAVGV